MKVLNFGSLNVDYVYQVEDFVRPGETISSLKREVFHGGKGLNQSTALARAGVTVYHAGAVGNDDGIGMRDSLAQSGVDVHFIKVKDCPSGHTMIQVNKEGENCIILYGGANQSITEEEINLVFEAFEQGDILLLQNEVNNNPYIMETAHKKGMIIMLNPSPMDKKIKELPLQYVDYFLLNEVEAEEMTGKTEEKEQLSALTAKFPQAKILLTMGAKGCCFQDADICLRQDSFPVKAVDTTAAGDTFTGYFIAGIVEGKPTEEVLRTAAKAASIAVSKKGASASIPYAEEVKKA